MSAAGLCDRRDAGGLQRAVQFSSVFPFGVDTLLWRSLGTGRPVWHLILRVRISLPPLATQCLYGKNTTVRGQPRTGEIIFDDFWPSG